MGPLASLLGALAFGSGVLGCTLLACSDETQPVKRQTGSAMDNRKTGGGARPGPVTGKGASAERRRAGARPNAKAERAIGQAMQIKRGEDALAAGNPSEAVRHLEQALQTLPGSPRAAEIHLLLGRAYEREGQPQRAVASFEKAVALEPANPAGHYLLALSYKQAKKLEAAHEAIRQAIRLAPANLVYRFDRVTIELQRGRKLQAEKSYTEYEKRRDDLIAKLKTTTDPVRKRLLALNALAAVPTDEKNLTALRQVLDDAKPEIRAAAAHALGRSGTRDPTLQKALQRRLEAESKPTVTQAIRQALANLPQPPPKPNPKKNQ
jgi:tetratricopeptide (TPR) repeat protein